jgi:hypothetical protein
MYSQIETPSVAKVTPSMNALYLIAQSSDHS